MFNTEVYQFISPHYYNILNITKCNERNEYHILHMIVI